MDDFDAYTTHKYEPYKALQPTQRTWVGLTDEEIAEVRHLYDWSAGWTFERFARQIEAKLKEKNT